jgi:large repetitive protein
VTVNGSLALFGAFNGSVMFADADFAGDTFTATVDYGDGSVPVRLRPTSTNFTLSHHYGLLGSHIVTVTITDEEGVSGSGSTTVLLL